MAGSLFQTWGAENGAAGTTLATGSATVATGSIVVILTNSDTNVSATVTKNAGTATIGTITQRETQTEAATFETTKVFTVDVTSGGTLDFLVTYGASDANRMIFAFELRGLSGFFGSNSATDTGSNPTPTLTVASATAPSWAFALDVDVQGGTPAVGTGFTDGGTFGSTVHICRAQYKSVTSSGNVTGDFGNASLDRNNTFLLVFTEPVPVGISTQPEQQSAASGGTATFSVTATGGTPPYSYQWRTAPVSADGLYSNVPGSWSNVGTNSTSYTTGTLSSADNGTWVSVVVTDSLSATVTSAFVRLFIRNLGVTGKASADSPPGLTAWYGHGYRSFFPGRGAKLLRKAVTIRQDPTFDIQETVWSDRFFAATSGAQSGSVSESFTLTDAQSVVATLNVAVSESFSLTDSQTGALNTAGAVSESLSLTDSQTAGLLVSGAVSESFALSDAVAAAASFAASVAESISLTESQSASVQFSVAVSESFTLADTQSSTGLFAGSISESFTLTDATDATVTGGGTVVSGDVAESFSLSDAQTVQANFAASLSESLTLSDSQSTVAVWVGSVSESFSLSDTQDAAQTTNAAVSESLTLADSQDATLGAQTYNVSVSESFSLSDSQEGFVLAPAPLYDGGVGGEKRKKKLRPKTAKEEVNELLDDVLANLSKPPAAPAPAPKPEPAKVAPAPAPQVQPWVTIPAQVELPPEDDDEALLLFAAFF